MILRRKGKVAAILDKCSTDAAIGCWVSKGGNLRIAHYYEAGSSAGLDHRFCSQNYRPLTYEFRRSVTATNCTYAPHVSLPSFEIKARPSRFVGCAEVVEAPCGSMTPSQSGTTVTTAELRLVAPLESDVPARITMVSNR